MEPTAREVSFYQIPLSSPLVISVHHPWRLPSPMLTAWKGLPRDRQRCSSFTVQRSVRPAPSAPRRLAPQHRISHEHCHPAPPAASIHRLPTHLRANPSHTDLSLFRTGLTEDGQYHKPPRRCRAPECAALETRESDMPDATGPRAHDSLLLFALLG